MNNLIAIEMKKSNRPDHEKDEDRKRLRAMTKESYDNVWSADGVTHPEHVCGYVLGLYMIININERRCDVEFYRKGGRFDDKIWRF